MKKSLVEMYVAYKASLHDLLFAEVRRVKPNGYVSEIMKRPLSELSVELQQDLVRRIRGRFNLKSHEPLFSNPTIGQWVTDICGAYTAEDLMSFFASELGFSVDVLKSVKLRSDLFCQEPLFTLLRQVEKATSKTLFGAYNQRDPLASLSDNLTFYDIARYFVCTPEETEDARQHYIRSFKKTSSGIACYW